MYTVLSNCDVFGSIVPKLASYHVVLIPRQYGCIHSESNKHDCKACKVNTSTSHGAILFFVKALQCMFWKTWFNIPCNLVFDVNSSAYLNVSLSLNEINSL